MRKAPWIVGLFWLATGCLGAGPDESARSQTSPAVAAQPARAAAPAAAQPAQAAAPKYGDALDAWVGDWATTSRIVSSSCAKWPSGESATGTTHLARPSSAIFAIDRINGWSAIGPAATPEATLSQQWVEPEGAPVTMTVAVKHDASDTLDLRTHVVIAAWSGEPKGCALDLEEHATRSSSN